MAHVGVLAQDECIRFTCAEVLQRFGFRTTMGPLRGGGFKGEVPDVILMWEAQVADVAEALASFGPVPLVVFTWDRRILWPESIRVVRPPFHGERLAVALHEAAQEAAAAVRRAPALCHGAVAAL